MNNVKRVMSKLQIIFTYLHLSIYIIFNDDTFILNILKLLNSINIDFSFNFTYRLCRFVFVFTYSFGPVTYFNCYFRFCV